MISKKKSMIAAALAIAAFAVTACSSTGSGPSASSTEPVGDPVAGGVMRIIEQMPISGFDPTQAMSSTSTPVTYSALYGDFLVPNPETGKSECNMCESFVTEDGGATYAVTLKEDITFSDGTPFNAEAVKYNWDRVKDPVNGSASAGYASQIAESTVIDEYTLKLTMTTPNPSFVANFSVYALQWIASPAALEAGVDAFNKNPIGAGPFVLESWTPNGLTKLVRNDDYYDDPYPYLDGLEIQGVTDTTQRLNALIAGDVDAIMASDPFAFEQGVAAGLEENIYQFNGGSGLMFNTSRPPFDDKRARQAIAYALDLDALSDASSNGYPTVPRTLFPEDSPFYEDTVLQEKDPEKAQELFDDLAAEGKPLEFEFSLFPGAAAQGTFDSLQSQLKQYDNVTVTARQHDASLQGVIGTTGDYDMLISSLAFTEPSGRLWGALYSDAGASNYSRFSDPAVDAALDAATSTDDVAVQKEQYKIVQERLAEEVPYILYNAFYNGLITTDKVQGDLMYGYTVPRASQLWLKQ